jgi:hypothetical protein
MFQEEKDWDLLIESKEFLEPLNEGERDVIKILKKIGVKSKKIAELSAKGLLRTLDRLTEFVQGEREIQDSLGTIVQYHGGEAAAEFTLGGMDERELQKWREEEDRKEEEEKKREEDRIELAETLKDFKRLKKGLEYNINSHEKAYQNADRYAKKWIKDLKNESDIQEAYNYLDKTILPKLRKKISKMKIIFKNMKFDKKWTWDDRDLSYYAYEEDYKDIINKEIIEKLKDFLVDHEGKTHDIKYGKFK